MIFFLQNEKFDLSPFRPFDDAYVAHVLSLLEVPETNRNSQPLPCRGLKSLLRKIRFWAPESGGGHLFDG